MSIGQIASLAVLAVVVTAVYLPTILPALADPKYRKHLLGALKHLAVAGALALTVSQFYVKKSDGPRPADPPVASALKSATSSDRAKVASIYRSLADVTQRDQGRLIASTAVWRAIHSDALRLAVGGTDLVGKYPGLDEAVEEVLAQHFPLDNKPLDKAQVDAIVAGCKAVEAQCE